MRGTVKPQTEPLGIRGRFYPHSVTMVSVFKAHLQMDKAYLHLPVQVPPFFPHGCSSPMNASPLLARRAGCGCEQGSGAEAPGEGLLRADLMFSSRCMSGQAVEPKGRGWCCHPRINQGRMSWKVLIHHRKLLSSDRCM